MLSKKIRLKSVVLILWGFLILFLLNLWMGSGVSFTQVPYIVQEWFRGFGLFSSALIYISLYTVRSITFFPGMWLSIASGLIFGPWFGVLFTIIGGNISSLVAFLAARYLGRDWVESREKGFMQKWDGRLRENGMVTVMILRLLYLPYDAVSYGCGLTSMKLSDYVRGTFIGTLPGIFTYVLLGGVASSYSSGTVALFGYEISQRLFVLLLSVLFLILGLSIAKMLNASLHEESE